jgi:hypothetical protein
MLRPPHLLAVVFPYRGYSGQGRKHSMRLWEDYSSITIAPLDLPPNAGALEQVFKNGNLTGFVPNFLDGLAKFPFTQEVPKIAILEK